MISPVPPKSASAVSRMRFFASLVRQQFSDYRGNCRRRNLTPSTSLSSQLTRAMSTIHFLVTLSTIFARAPTRVKRENHKEKERRTNSPTRTNNTIHNMYIISTHPQLSSLEIESLTNQHCDLKDVFTENCRLDCCDIQQSISLVSLNCNSL